MKIENAKAEDLDIISGFLSSLFEQDLDFEPDNKKQIIALKMILEHPELGEIFVIKDNEKIIGTLSLFYSISTALGGKAAVIEDVFIIPDKRRSGAGAKLLNYAIEHAKKKGCLRATLLTDFNNNAAISFYQKNGFVKSSMIPLRIIF